MTALQIWLENHNRRLTQAAIDEALMEYIAHVEKTRDELLAALELWLDIHDNPVGFGSKYGKSLTDSIAAQEVKVNAAASAARTAIARVKGGAA